MNLQVGKVVHALIANSKVKQVRQHVLNHSVTQLPNSNYRVQNQITSTTTRKFWATDVLLLYFKTSNLEK